MAFHAADGADAERDIDAGDVDARPREGADEAGPRVRRTADHLHRLAVAGIDRQHLQLVGLRMLLGRSGSSR